MKTKTIPSPNESGQTNVDTELNNPTPKTKRRVPAKDDDFGDLCEMVAGKWKENADFTLRYITQLEFEAMTNNYNGTLETRQQTGGNRPTLTGQLAEADTAIDNAIGYVKDYLKHKYEKQSQDHYAAFGIVHRGKNFEFPTNREKRKNALKLIVKAIVSEGFSNEKYGKDFWSDMYSNYKSLLSASKESDGTVSNKVGDKNQLKEELATVLNSLIGLVTANFPKTYAAELRKWGFQKEKY